MPLQVWLNHSCDHLWLLRQELRLLRAQTTSRPQLLACRPVYRLIELRRNVKLPPPLCRGRYKFETYPPLAHQALPEAITR